MIFHRPTAIAFVAVFAAACAPTTSQPVDPLVAPFVGKTLSNTGNDITFNADGTINGTAGPDRDINVSGVWEVRNGRFCRTITEPATLPEGIPATECQEVVVDGNQVTFTSPTGRTSQLTIL